MIGAKPSKKPRALARWRYSVRWALPHLPGPGPRELAAAEVDAGAPCPPEVEATRSTAGSVHSAPPTRSRLPVTRLINCTPQWHNVPNAWVDTPMRP